MAEVARLYLKDGSKVADITYGKGVFWKEIDQSHFELFASDLLTCSDCPYDFINLPYNDKEFDIVVFDPPYCHNPGHMITDKNYQNRATTRGFYHKDIIELYRLGMTEGVRILKKNGFLWVKCKDEIESSQQQMSHIEIHDIAVKELDLYVKDLFILMQKNRPVIQFKNQQHARKNHSYLWIFKKDEK